MLPLIAFGDDSSTAMSTTTKYALAASAVAVVGGAIWYFTRKKGGLKANGRSKRAASSMVDSQLRYALGTLAHNKQFTIAELSQYAGITMSSAAGVARRLVSSGKIERVGRGKYFPTRAGWDWIEMTRNGKLVPGWQKKFYHGAPTAFRGVAPKKYRKYGATEPSHYAFPEAFKYPIHGKDAATTKRFIRTAAARFAKWKGRIEPKYRAQVAARIEAAKKKYGIGVYNPKHKTKTAAKHGRRAA